MIIVCICMGLNEGGNIVGLDWIVGYFIIIIIISWLYNFLVFILVLLFIAAVGAFAPP